MLHISKILSRYGIRPFKARGQNFLVDKNILRKIVEAADVKTTDTVLEIGPGLGMLTKELAARAKRVVAVEVDARLVEALRDILGEFTNVEVALGDALTIDLKNFLPEKFALVANIPYSITSPILERFLEHGPWPESATLLVQKEVAERVTASPGEMSVLAVAAQFFSRPKIVARVSRGAFFPPPKVDSAILRLTDIRPRVSDVEPREFMRLVRAGFVAKRKKLSANLAGFFQVSRQDVERTFEGSGFNKNIRAQELSVDEWLKIFRALR